MEREFLISDCVLIPTGGSLKSEYRLNRGNPIISYFESIKSPSISLSLQFIDVDQLVSNKGITGGEYLKLRISTTGYNDFEITPEHKMMLNSVKDVRTSSRKEMARLEFVSVESIVNETARLSKKFAGPVSETVRKILEDDEKGIKTTKSINTDASVNSYSFVGNLKRPFDTIQWLCAKSSASTDSFGFLFFETLDGYEFRSFKSLLEQNPVEYKKTETSSEISEVDNDLRILENNFNQSNDIGLNCRFGMYANKTIYVNIDDATLKYVDFKLDSLNLENTPKLPNQLETYPTRLMFRVLDKGALQKGSEKEEMQKENELAVYQSLSYARANLIFAQSMSIAIPFNPDLRVGKMLNLRFGIKKQGELVTTTESDFDVGGKYLISELRHDIGDNRAKTTLKLIRDTYTA